MPLPITGYLSLPTASPVFWSMPMILLILSELTGDFFGKQWTLHKKSILFFTSLSFYVIGNAFWLFSILNGVGLARGTILFAVGQEIAAIAMAIIYFKETLNKKQWAGMMLGLISITLVSVI